MSSKIEELNEDKKAEILSKMIDMVTRQTDYTWNEAKELLETNNWDYNLVIRKYMGICEKKEVKNTLNQEIFNQIRKQMDSAGSKFYNN
tara:strand:+ start:44 stop:310 length:267 start_codon:yes stop_codon:yes gene_type:complete